MKCTDTLYIGGGSSGDYIDIFCNKIRYCYKCQESNEESTKIVSTTSMLDGAIGNCVKEKLNL